MGKSSILQRYVDSQSTLHQAYTSALREAINSTELKALDEIADIILDTGKQYGVSFTDTVNNKIIMQSGSFSSTVGVFDGNIPLTQRGKGSQRLLSIGLNIQSFSGNSHKGIPKKPVRIRRLSLIRAGTFSSHDSRYRLFHLLSDDLIAEVNLTLLSRFDIGYSRLMIIDIIFILCGTGP